MNKFLLLILAFTVSISATAATKITVGEPEAKRFSNMLNKYGLPGSNEVVLKNSDVVIRNHSKSGYLVCETALKACKILETLESDDTSTSWPPKHLIKKDISKSEVDVVFNFFSSHGIPVETSFPKMNIFCWYNETTSWTNIDRHTMSPLTCEVTVF